MAKKEIKPTTHEVIQIEADEFEVNPDALIVDEDNQSMDIVTDEAQIRALAAELDAKYPPGFKIKSKADYEEMSRDLRGMVSIRTKTNKRRLSLKRIVDAAAGVITDLFAPVEDRLKAVKSEWDQKEADRLAAIEAAKKKKREDRAAQLFKLGAAWQGSAYQLGSATALPGDLDKPDGDWGVLIHEFNEEKSRLDREAQAAEIARKAEEEEARRVAAENARLKAEADRVAAENAKLAAKLKEMEDAKAREEVKEEPDEPKMEPAKVTMNITPAEEPEQDMPADQSNDKPAPPTSKPQPPRFVAVMPTTERERQIYLSGVQRVLAEVSPSIISKDYAMVIWKSAHIETKL